jgi:Protein of unknown function (DUF2848)
MGYPLVEHWWATDVCDPGGTFMALMVDLVSSSGTRQQVIPIKRVFNLGSATRNPETARAHQDEVKHIGISIAFDVPAPRIYPMADYVVTTDTEVCVQGERSSGEVEIVLYQGDELYVGVGSDHTDRTLEKVSIVWSKQACANVLAPTLWRFADIASHWDQCRMRSHVGGKLYQDCGVAAFLTPQDMLRILSERTLKLPAQGTMVFCGTIASIDKTMGFGAEWSFEMTDPVLGRSIRHAYTVVNLMHEIRPEFRVPVASREL